MLLKSIAIYVIIHIILIIICKKNFDLYAKYHLLFGINQLKMKLKYFNYLKFTYDNNPKGGRFI